MRNQPIERFDPAKLEARLSRAKAALVGSEYEFAGEILTEMESEGHLHPEIRPLRRQIDQANRNRTIRQLLESAERRLKDDEYQLALEKIQQIIQIDPGHPEALRLKTSIESKRSSQQIDNWLRLASDHLDNFSFGHARQALQKLMQLKPGDTRALQLLESVDRKEQTYLAIKREKEQHYQAALECWRQGEVTSALSQVERLMALDREAPERSDVEKGAAYQELFNKVRSEHENLRNAYDEAKKHVEDGNFAAGLAICDKYLEKYPHHALFQSLRLDVGEAERQALSAFIAKVDREVQGEPDLDRKVGMLEAALARHPGESHFEQALKAVSARRGHINAIVARAQNLEERGQYTEALNQWEMLRSVYRQYPGLAFEVERLERRKEQQATADRKTRIIEQADAALKSGDFTAALRIILSAQADFPDDAELMPMEKLARDGIERLVKAEELIFQSRNLIGEGRFDEGLKLLNDAYGIAERSEYVRAALVEALLNRSSAAVDADPHYAESLVKRVLTLDGANAQARSLRLRIADRKRESMIHGALSRARQFQADGQVDAAACEVTRALEAYPKESRLNQLRQTLQQALDESQRHNEHSQDLEALKLPEQPPSANQGGQASLDDSDIGATRMFQNAGRVSPPNPAPSKPVPREAAPPPKLASAARAAAAMSSQVAEKPPQAPVAPQTPIPPARESIEYSSAWVPPPQAPKANGTSFKLAAVAAGVALVVAAIVFTYLHRRPGPPPTPKPSAYPVVFKSNVAAAHLLLDGKSVTLLGESLRAGPHTLAASSDGYLPATKTFTVAAGQSSPLAVEINLQPAPAELRIASDLTSGQVVLDGTASELRDGGLVRTDLGPGDHTLRITEGGQDLVSFSFTAKPLALPIVNGPVTTRRIQAVVISSLGTSARLWSSTGLKGGVTEDTIQPIAADGVGLSGLVTGSSTFLVEDGKTPRRTLALAATAVPAIRVDLGAERKTGTIIVHCNVSDAAVVVNGTVLKQPMKDGKKVLSLEPNTYQIKVVHPDYQQVAEQSVDLKKGDITKLTFDLLPTLKMGTLALERFPPDAEVSVDGINVGSTDSQGNFTKQLTPGAHTITVHKAGYDDSVLKREIKPNMAVAIAGETVMPRQGTVTFKVNPASAQLTYTREGGTQTSSATSGQSVALPAGNYRVSAEADGFEPKSESFVVGSGKSVSVDVVLSPVPPPPPTELTVENMCQDPHQWSLENKWWHHTSQETGWFKKNSGDFSFLFVKQSSKVFFKNKMKHVEWVVDSQPNGDRVSYILDEHMLHREAKIGATTQEWKVRHGLEAENTYQVHVDISPERIVIRGRNGQVLDDYKRPNASTALGKFGFSGDVMLSISSIR